MNNIFYYYFQITYFKLKKFNNVTKNVVITHEKQKKKITETLQK